MMNLALTTAAAGGRLPDAAARSLSTVGDLALLMPLAARLRDAAHGDVITYSRKVFIPLTRLCRDVCHYCTFATTPGQSASPYLDLAAVLAIARAGAAAGCTEALFTLGDQPELRYAAAREALAALGHPTTLSYLAAAARAVRDETGLLPHLNPGVMRPADLQQLRPVSASMGLMLESTSLRLCERGGPHFGSPDKHPAVRLATLDAAGAAAVPFTTGLLIGIGETRADRIDTLLQIRASHERYGHVQEVIVQNFCAKPGTLMANHPDAPERELLWTLAVARLILGGEMNLQAPPNLAPGAPGALGRLVEAGLNDWGGVSPVTLDHVNPERPWPQIERLAALTAEADKQLVARLPVYPAYAVAPARWLDGQMQAALLRLSDASGHARTDAWRAGDARCALPQAPAVQGRPGVALDRVAAALARGDRLDEPVVESLFGLRGAAQNGLCQLADELRQRTVGDAVSHVVNRNINYTNICALRCTFCAFSKGRSSADLRGPAYDLPLAEIERRASEAWAMGASEVCLQGGIHPAYDGHTYLRILAAVKRAQPGMHVHAFSPLEVWHGATTLGLPLDEYLVRLREAGLGSLPGTAAEILDDEIRARICPDKLNTAQWLQVMAAAHRAGLKTTATILFGHVEQPRHWARHLLAVRDQQARTGGFTEFVPLPFVAQEAPMFRRGQSRPGPTWREALLMHAVARLVLHPLIPNIQASWVKLGPQGVLACLQAGANDFGGTLIDESITRAAGATFGQHLQADEMRALSASIGRPLVRRTTLYGRVSPVDPTAPAPKAAPVRAIVPAIVPA